MWPFKRKEWEKLGAPMDSALLERILSNWLAPAAIYTRDRAYRAIPCADFENLMFDCWFPLDEPDYKAEIFDCDDWTVCCMAAVKTRWAEVSRGTEALAFGYIEALLPSGVRHAFIWHVSPNGTIAFYEPQTGKRRSDNPAPVYLVET